MSFRTRLYGRLATSSRNGQFLTFSQLPPLRPPEPVKLKPVAQVWDVPELDLVAPDPLPLSLLPRGERFKVSLLTGLQSWLPNTEQSSRWDRATARAHLTDVVNGGVPSALWPDWETDEGWARMFVQGPLATSLERRGDAFVVDGSMIRGAVHHGDVGKVGCVGAIRFENGRPLPAWVELDDGTRVKPGDQGWEVARLATSAGLQTFVVYVRHLIDLHLMAAQPFGVLMQNHLPFEHPLHRLIFPHVAGSLAVNWRASRNLIGRKGAVQSTYSFPWTTLQGLHKAAVHAFSPAWHVLPARLEASGTRELVDKGLYPWGEDALLVWRAIDEYVGEYVALYYPDDASVRNDVALQAGWAEMPKLLPSPPPCNTVAELRLNLTRFIFMVTAVHRLVGGTGWDYFTVPYFFPHRVYPGEKAEDVVPFREESEANVVGKWSTMVRSWPLDSDWSYVAVDEKGAAVMKGFKASLARMGEEIDDRNTRRKNPFPHMHPRELESSVAV